MTNTEILAKRLKENAEKIKELMEQSEGWATELSRIYAGGAK